MIDLAIIIPTLNEAANIGRAVLSARALFPGAKTLVVDGENADGTSGVARAAGASVIVGRRGRGVQYRAGAAAVSAEWLLFLHADTLLPENAPTVIAEFAANRAAQIATFRLRFDDGSWFLRACCWFTRFDSVFTRFGDQGILVRRSFYESLGGFSAWPLFEDVAFLQRARARIRVHSLPAAVTTSARRFRQRGIYRQQFLNASLLLRYLAGSSPESLAAKYLPCSGRVAPVAPLAPGTTAPGESASTRVAI